MSASQRDSRPVELPGSIRLFHRNNIPIEQPNVAWRLDLQFPKLYIHTWGTLLPLEGKGYLQGVVKCAVQ
jgi:hypothetical protein